jgi:hypothetical protein
MAQKEVSCMEVLAFYMAVLPEGSRLRIGTDLYLNIMAKEFETETRGWFVVGLTPPSVPPDCTGTHV